MSAQMSATPSRKASKRKFEQTKEVIPAGPEDFETPAKKEKVTERFTTEEKKEIRAMIKQVDQEEESKFAEEEKRVEKKKPKATREQQQKGEDTTLLKPKMMSVTGRNKVVAERLNVSRRQRKIATEEETKKSDVGVVDFISESAIKNFRYGRSTPSDPAKIKKTGRKDTAPPEVIEKVLAIVRDLESKLNMSIQEKDLKSLVRMLRLFNCCVRVSTHYMHFALHLVYPPFFIIILSTPRFCDIFFLFFSAADDCDG